MKLLNTLFCHLNSAVKSKKKMNCETQTSFRNQVMLYLQVRLQNPSTKPLVYQVLLAGKDAADFRLPMGEVVQVSRKPNGDEVLGGSVVEWVRAPDLKSGGPGFKSRSDRWQELFLGSPEFNSSASLVCLLPVEIFNHVILFQESLGFLGEQMFAHTNDIIVFDKLVFW